MNTRAMLLAAAELADAVDAAAAFGLPPNLAPAVAATVEDTRADLCRSIAAVRVTHALIVAYREVRG